MAINDSGKILLYEEDRNSKEFKESYIAYPTLFHGQPLPGSVLELSPLEFKASAINNKGHISGENYVKIDRSIIDICPDSNDFYTAHYTAYAINDNDSVVGLMIEGIYPYHVKPFKWEIEIKNRIRDYILTELPIPEGWTSGFALDINNKEQIVGFVDKSYSRTYRSTAMMWENEGCKELPPLTTAYSINNNGQVAGTTRKGVVIWDNNGQVAGTTGEAVVWDNNEVTYLSDFIDPNNNPDGWDYLYEAIKINDNGWVIGYGHKHSNRPFEDRTPISFLAIPKENTKTLSADSNNDGIVNALDLADLGNQWLEKEDWYEE